MEPETSNSLPDMDGKAREELLQSSRTEDDTPRDAKRKWHHKDMRLQHGSKRHKRRDMGRQEYFRQNTDKRQRNAEEQEKRANNRNTDRRDDKANPFTKEEIEAEARQPKRKVAVMMGYAGSGYKGMQMMPGQRTIEGDLFAAFVKVGAISKANADDPKKSSFVRCARTDKGVHAAGNVISLKLIIEDPAVVEKINEQLPQQIRVWGIERVVGGFSCYQACDSRWYEYLIPTHCFLPPHPTSYMGQKLVELAEEVGDLEGYKSRQQEVEGFWEKVEEDHIRPLLDTFEPALREQIEQALYHVSTDESALMEDEEGPEELVVTDEADNADLPGTETAEGSSTNDVVEATDDNAMAPTISTTIEEPPSNITPEQLALRTAIKQVKDAYLLAKRQWRIPQARLKRVQEALETYKGTHNFHNYTIRKSHRDPSAKRHIISFNVNPTPILIGDTEWLSLKVHGQSFMMHQIRKMVGMAALVVRCGAVIHRVMDHSFGESLYSIPKAPALGLLLERPVFETYNSKAKDKFEREEVSFVKYEKEMEAFKRKEIYERIFTEEEQDQVYHSFFTHVDNFRTPIFLYLSSKGLEACGDARPEPATKHDRSRKERANFQKSRGGMRGAVELTRSSEPQT